MKKLHYLFISNILLFLPVALFAQTPADTATSVITLKQSIDFALHNQPQLKTSQYRRAN
jgi:hypothetical protein